MIIGGGLSGVSAAIGLAESDLRVVLLEKRHTLGGRASSFRDPQVGLPVDVGQHVLMACCTNLLDLYRRLDVESHIRFYDRFLFIDTKGKRTEVGSSILPAPLHLLPSLLRFSPLTGAERVGVMRVFRAILSRNEGTLDSVSALDWLMRNGQSVQTIGAFWGPLLVSALNELPMKVSAAAAHQVLREGFLKNREGYRLGVPRVPLELLHGEPCLGVLRDMGVVLRRGTEAASIEFEGNRAVGVALTDGGFVRGDCVIAAVPPKGLLRLLPEEVITRERGFRRLEALRFSPITTAHLWLDREIEAPDHAALLDRQFHWIFHRKWRMDPVGGGSYLQLVASASHGYMAMPREAIGQVALRELQDALPETREARLLSSQVIKVPHATLSLQPGSERRRPGPSTPILNLLLAGDWTDTGWPATMESAVRSGYRAAECVLGLCGQESSLLQPDLKPDGLSRWLLARKEPPGAETFWTAEDEATLRASPMARRS